MGVPFYLAGFGLLAADSRRADLRTGDAKFRLAGDIGLIAALAAGGATGVWPTVGLLGFAASRWLRPARPQDLITPQSAVVQTPAATDLNAPETVVDEALEMLEFVDAHRLSESTRKVWRRVLRARCVRVLDRVGGDTDPRGYVSLFDLCADQLALGSTEDAELRLDRSCRVFDDLPRFVLVDGPALRKACDRLRQHIEASGRDWNAIRVAEHEDGFSVGFERDVDEVVEWRGFDADLRAEACGLGATLRREIERRTEIWFLDVPALPAPSHAARLKPGRFFLQDVGRGPDTGTASGPLCERRLVGIGLSREQRETLMDADAELDQLQTQDADTILSFLERVPGRDVVVVWRHPEVDAMRRLFEREGARERYRVLALENDPSTRVDLASEGAAICAHLRVEGEGLLAIVLDLVTAGSSLEALQRWRGNLGRLEPTFSRLADDPFLGAMVARYVEAVPGFLDELHEARRLDDRTAIRSVSHRIKGSGRQYGFDAASACGAMCQFLVDDAAEELELQGALEGLERELLRILAGAVGRRPDRPGRFAHA